MPEITEQALTPSTQEEQQHVVQAIPTLRFVDYSAASLKRLQQEGLIRQRIPKKILELLSETPWEEIVENHSQLLTSEGIRMHVDCKYFLRQRENVSRMNLEAVAQRGSREESATDKQANFLRSLGVKDENFLSNLGKSQASSVIEYILENRNG